jgi:type IV fimbrial biogenesis protein FimT
VRRLRRQGAGNLDQVAKASGFTVTELMVTIAVFALLAAIAVPTLRNVMANSRVRATAESLQSGLALARAEAVRLNTRVEFVVTANGWNINRIAGGALLQQASGKERAGGLNVTATPGGADRITFNAFGRVESVNPSNGSAPLTQLDITAANPSSNYRPLRVQVFSGGLARSCDPAAAATEPKACL